LIKKKYAPTARRQSAVSQIHQRLRDGDEGVRPGESSLLVSRANIMFNNLADEYELITVPIRRDGPITGHKTRHAGNFI
jgi:hypothetical protein